MVKKLARRTRRKHKPLESSHRPMFDRTFIANRGKIARRITRNSGPWAH